MDDIVRTASLEAAGRVRVLLIVSVARALVGALWAASVMIMFGRVWRPYVAALNRLQLAEKHLRSMLSSAFDVVVPVKTTSPWEVLQSSSSIDHFFGHEVEGKSILQCAKGPLEQDELASALKQEHSVSFNQKTVGAFWWNVVPMELDPRTRVGQMIRTSLSRKPQQMPGGAMSQQDMKVEIVMVGSSGPLQEACVIYLGIRQLGCQMSDVSTTASEIERHQPSDSMALELLSESTVREEDPLVDAVNNMVYQEQASQQGHRTLSASGSSGRTCILEGGQVNPMTPRSQVDSTPPPSLMFGMRQIPSTPLSGESRSEPDLVQQLSSALGGYAQHEVQTGSEDDQPQQER